MRHPLSIYIRHTNRACIRFKNKVSHRISKLFKSNTTPSNGTKEIRQTIDQNTLRNALLELGVSLGDTLLVHSGISNLGKILGGPKFVFDTINELIGQTGHMLYPVFPFDTLMHEYVSNHPPIFDVKSSPSKMGALSEFALRTDGGQRSVHPTHSIIAFGPNKSWFVKDHHLCKTPFADLSPFSRLVESSGKILLIGVGLNSTTSFHRIEDKLGINFPIKVYKDKIFTLPCLNIEGQPIKVNTLAHDPFISKVRDCNLAKEQLIKHGALREIPLGNGTIAIIDAKALDDCLQDLYLNQRLTIYGKIWG